MSEPPGPGEHLEQAVVAQLVELALDRPLELLEVALDLLVAEEIVREGTTAGEELLGQLPEEHPAVGEPLARLALRQGIEGAHARGREEEEVTRVAAVDDERIAVTGTGRGQPRDRIGGPLARIPWQRDGGDGREGFDRAQTRRTM